MPYEMVACTLILNYFLKKHQNRKNGQRLRFRFRVVVLWYPSLGEVLPPDTINGSG